SMDIQVASNFERLLFDIHRRDGRAVRALMASLAQSRRFALSAQALSALRAVFSADRADENETAATIRTMLRETGHLIDPHTAVGVAVAEKETRDPSIPMVVLGTATQPNSPMRWRQPAVCGPCFPNGSPTSIGGRSACPRCRSTRWRSSAIFSLLVVPHMKEPLHERRGHASSHRPRCRH